MEVSQCYSRSWKCPKQFKYQKQQLSVACVWPTLYNHSLATVSQASNESLDGCHLNIVPLFSEGISQFHESCWLERMSQNRYLWHVPNMLDRVEIRLACWPVHTGDGLLLEVLLNHPGTMRSSVVIHQDELGSDCTSIRSDADVQDLIPVA